MSGIKKYSLSKDGNKALSANFKVREFRCKDGSDSILIDDNLVLLLQKIRDHFGKPVTINSAYRNKAYNAKVGGVSNSQHTLGTACDIVVSGIAPVEVARFAEYLMPKSGGIGQYSNFVHVDTRAKRSRWTNFGREKSVSGFPGYIPKVASPSPGTLKTGNDIVWQLMNGRLMVEINEPERAVNALDKARENPDFDSLYWIIRKVVNEHGF